MGAAKGVVAGVVLGVVGFILFLSFLPGSVQILHSTGVLKSNIDVFWDSACTNKTVEINWGALEPGEETSVVLYLVNNKDSYATMMLDTENWNPMDAVYYMTLLWNCSYPLPPDTVVPVKLTLRVDNYVKGITTFGFDIVMHATWT
ncbi:MAG: hypothetical protein OEY30_01795 [Candidatus Bathyarchaeota archaeon]|nr:hypothetical protein [Candidatus Bathyarchaeota archaeon]